MPDQAVDRTYGRDHTYFDGQTRPDGQTPAVVHITLADPYCPNGRRAVGDVARRWGGSRRTAAPWW